MTKTLFLAQDMLIQVLLRLPVKSLVRFKSVSKSWLSLISDPQFATLHFELTATRTQKLALLVPKSSEIRFIDINSPSLHDDSASVVMKLNFLLPEPQYTSILGSCREFITFTFPDLVVWNPATGVYKPIPLSPVYSDTVSKPLPFLRGFGYDPSTDDYLITEAAFDRLRTSRMGFFSLKANMWKECEGSSLPYGMCCTYFHHRIGLLFNGALHWFAYNYDREQIVIVVFDLSERSVFDMALPHDFDHDLSLCELRELGGFLSLCFAGHTGIVANIAVDIWVMEEYKVQTSWTRRHILVPLNKATTRYLSPLYITKSGDIVGTDGSTSLVKFNNEGEVKENRSYFSVSRPLGCEVMYVESLLSFPGDI